ncbi:SulP family inorganic anion transporter [Pelomonas sp. SE-A7]|uniref:SulP family inorganic anion transporter n=1 Tax=Pelomonas sp. SE-A7 TaxID=3054953 RepID=UPI00259C6EA0|nr:SulP family inorganic anion transporter [Pelomonas sp. SE-A7]MDM4767146.1 SulP family inorganic anion transporter [Pelomonas sp. SE-A7]
MAAALESWRDYPRRLLREDFSAALVVSVLLIPQSLAYALLAGLPAQVGLYASLLPLLAYALLGSSPVLGIGPVAVLALMISQALAALPAGVSPAEGALVLAVEVGLVMLLAALLRLDALASLLSVPVLQGFEAGATLSIALSQLPPLLGPSGRWEIQPATAAFGLGAVSLLFLARRFLKGQPGRFAPLAVLLLSLALAWGLQAQGHGVSLVGALPPLSLQFSLPRLEAEIWRALLPHALLLGLMAYVSSLVVAESLARRRGERVDARRELLGLGAANVVAGCCGAMPVASSFSRSVLMHDAGSRSRMTGVFVALLMGLAAWLLAEPLAWLPKAVLAATILVAVLSGLRLQPYLEAWRFSRPEALLMGLVTIAVLALGLSAALALGVAGSIALLLQRTARPHVALIGRVPGTEHYRNVDRHQVECRADVLGLRIDESLVFTNARSLADVVQVHLDHHPGTRRIVLLMSPVNAIDFSGLEALRELQGSLERQQVRLDLSEVKGPVLDRLRAGGWEQWFRGQIFLSHHQGMSGD